jgi:hypothetical protein
MNNHQTGSFSQSVLMGPLLGKAWAAFGGFGGGSECKFVFNPQRSPLPQAIEAQDTFQMRKQHLSTFFRRFWAISLNEGAV